MRAFLWVAILAVSMSGCANSPQAKFYTLNVRSQPDAARQERVSTTAPVRIAIASVTVPDLIDRPQIVARIDATQVGINEFERWAEPLKGQIAQVIAADLAQLVPGALVSSDPSWGEDMSTIRVSVDVQSFESVPGGNASIAVLWAVRPPQEGEIVRGRSTVQESTGGQGYDALVDAHSRALAAVSSDIARAIGAMPRAQQR
ncbi:hypothetical protein AKI39_18250 [Bordetella sp. H567]|uniref:PqiC family protein n=1 Tax=Bordetella sp. H567 TaxID=1697043 RepID=UPI00081CF7C3|nr:PqiC family protein [Bordetella sp. H567]AOB32244.1 hypothetical protein AKI39_18250 [Bordetella sp. H567]